MQLTKEGGAGSTGSLQGRHADGLLMKWAQESRTYMTGSDGPRKGRQHEALKIPAAAVRPSAPSRTGGPWWGRPASLSLHSSFKLHHGQEHLL